MTRFASERNEKFAVALRRLADLLRSEDPDGNEFRGYTFKEAARVVENLRGDMTEIEDPEALRGIGKSTGALWREWAETGRLGRLEEMERRLASGEFPDVNDLTRMRGIGIKKARQIHQVYGVTTVEELADKVKAGEIRDQRLLEALDTVWEHGRRFRWQDAVEILERFVRAYAQALSRSGISAELVVAGSARRHGRTDGRMGRGSKDGDLLAVFPHEDARRAGLQVFTELVADPSGGERRATGRFENLRVDLMTALERQGERYPTERGPALLHSTGPGEYNQALRIVAKEKGLRLNERGLFGADGLRRDDGTEDGVRLVLGVKTIGPERRGTEPDPASRARRLRRGGRRGRGQSK
jgi:DNA polymerase (family 10)